MQKITPFLWFDGKAEEAMNFYLSIFKSGKIIGTSNGPDGNLMVATFELEGQRFMALNGGPMFSFTPAISFLIDCRTQDEIDEFWEKLGEGGKYQQCGWLQDKYGVSWQVIPSILGDLVSDPDPAKAGRVMQAMMSMVKLDIAKLQEAYDKT